MRYQVSFLQCIAPLATGLLGLWLYRGHKDRVRKILGGLLLGGLGMWYGQLTLLALDRGEGRLETLAAGILAQVGDGSPWWGAFLGAQKALVNMLISAVIVLVLMLIVVGMGAARSGQSFTRAPKGFWGNIVRIALLALLCAPLAGAILGYAVVAGQSIEGAVIGITVGLPTALGGLVAAICALRALWLPFPAPAEETPGQTQ